MFKKVSGILLSLSLVFVFTFASQALAADWEDKTLVKYYKDGRKCPPTITHKWAGYKLAELDLVASSKKGNDVECIYKGTIWAE